MKSLLITLLMGAAAHAAPSLNPPNLVGRTQLGRLPLFTSPKGTDWALPMAFSTDISCSPDTSAYTTCKVIIHNALSSGEESAIQNSPHDTIIMSTFEPQTNMSVSESFSHNLSATVQESKLQTLSLNKPNMQYSALVLRVPSSERQSILDSFNNGGLGTFKSVAKFYGETVAEYLAITDIQTIQAALSSVQDQSVTGFELRKLLKKISGSVAVTNVGYDTSDVSTIMEYELRRRFFRAEGLNRYRLNSMALTKLSAPLILSEQSLPGGPITCTGTIELRVNAQPNIVCQ